MSGLGKAELWLRNLQHRWIDRLQGDLVLPTARTLYLAGAFAALAALVISLLAVLWFQLSSLRPMPTIPAPPTRSTAAVVMGLGPIDARLAPPTNVRFIVDQALISDILTDHAILGHFEASTPNGLANPPDDFQVIGGSDEALFVTDQAMVSADSRAADPAGAAIRPGTVLRAAPALVDQINAELPTLTAQKARAFELRVLATDATGVNAPPLTVTFNLIYGPKGAAPLPVAPAAAAESPLTKLAREIALVVDPARTPAYFEAFDRAVAMPQICGADEAVFTPQYRAAFDHARPKLKAANIEAFYTGLCESWSLGIREREQAGNAAQAQWANKVAAAEIARAETALKKFKAKTLRNLALLFVGGALVTFLTIAVLLAFLAIEGHSKAVRQVVELLAAQNLQPGPERKL